MACIRTVLFALSLTMLGCSATTEPRLEYVEVPTPIPVMPAAPAELVSCLQALPQPRFVEVQSDLASIGILRGDEWKLRELIERPIVCARAWATWALSPDPESLP